MWFMTIGSLVELLVILVTLGGRMSSKLDSNPMTSLGLSPTKTLFGVF